MTIDVRPAASRFHTVAGWLDSWHSFSFGQHYDPANTGHGLLLVNNDDRVAPGAGFGTHGHRDMEIVTWVLSGELAHRDSTGTDDVIRPGLAQRMSAGTGIRHSELNASTTEPVHFVQMWVAPDTAGVEPGYEQVDIGRDLAGGTLVPVASGRPDGSAITINQHDATLHAAQLPPGAAVELPDAPHVHVFVAVGGAALETGGSLAAGDAVRMTAAGAQRCTAGPAGAELLVWATA